MYIINKSARLIDFSWDKEKYRLMPAGAAVEVPDEAMKSAFLKSLIKDGSVAKESQEEQIDLVDEVAEIEKAEAVEDKECPEAEDLRTQAETLGIKVDKRWGEDRLNEEIEKALA